jgi:16S rRNA (cytosine1402-N4)-methyltransferase
VFLALRSAVNDEAGVLRKILTDGPSMLSVGGRMAIITFHSLEDRIVKEAFRSLAKDESGERRYALVTKKPVAPTFAEQKRNPRSRSAHLRALERVS